MNYIAPSGPAFGALFKWNKSKRYAWRGHVIHGSFTADDTKSNMPSREQRKLKMDQSVLEFSAGLEFNFVEYNLHKLGPAFTPYLYTGITYFRYEYKYFSPDQAPNDDGTIGPSTIFGQTDGSMAIPMTAGAKFRLSQYLILGAEIGARYTFTDNLDASNPEGTQFEDFRLGNVFSDDWYVFSGITLTFAFGRKPCQDCFE
jgi:hypothetical protein